ncbi:hypothetical protein BLNAU_19889 [Blattamonas nauphoetae]|uniref:Adhesin domain-containing protein n=1 Tax=Blattamonas nauphoetae TaxID=2049346 RepID=A0ABQ9X0B3_9EUKA|nr:hypothetical protein BLNAU_19889 [Blattamonas nauphoetae]
MWSDDRIDVHRGRSHSKTTTLIAFVNKTNSASAQLYHAHHRPQDHTPSICPSSQDYHHIPTQTHVDHTDLDCFRHVSLPSDLPIDQAEKRTMLRRDWEMRQTRAMMNVLNDRPRRFLTISTLSLSTSQHSSSSRLLHTQSVLFASTRTVEAISNNETASVRTRADRTLVVHSFAFVNSPKLVGKNGQETVSRYSESSVKNIGSFLNQFNRSEDIASSTQGTRLNETALEWSSVEKGIVITTPDNVHIHFTPIGNVSVYCEHPTKRLAAKFDPLAAKPFSFKNIRYDQTQTLSTSEPSYVWITGESFSDWITPKDSRFEGSYESTDIEDKWLWAHDSSDSFSVSMLFYLKEKTGPVGVEKDGKDNAVCGYFSFWCQSLQHSLGRMQAMNTAQLNVMGIVGLETAITFEDELRLHGKADDPKLALSAAAALKCVGNEDFRFDHLHFSLSSDLSADAVVSVQSGRLSVEDGTLSSSANFEKVFVEAQTGRVEFVGVTLLTTIGGEGKLVHSETSNVSLTSVTFPTSLKTLGTIVDLTEGELSIDTDVFSSLKFTKTPFVLASPSAVTLLKVNVSSYTIDEFLTVSSGSLSIQNCVFTGSLPSSNDEDENEDDLCDWVSGIFNLTDCSTEVRQSEFSRFPQGVFNIKNGELTLSHADFVENHAGNTTSPQREDQVPTNNHKHRTNTEPTPRWISTTECSVADGTTPVDTPFTAPTLDTQKTEVTASSTHFTLAVVGTLLVPCNLILEVFENTAPKAGQITVGELTSLALTDDNTTDWSETAALLTVSTSLLKDQ